MSLNSVLDSMQELLEIRAKSRLNSMREQILWKTYCNSIVENSIQTNDSNQQKIITSFRDNNCNNNNNNNNNNNDVNSDESVVNVINNNNKHMISNENTTELKNRFNFLGNALKNSQNF